MTDRAQAAPADSRIDADWLLAQAENLSSLPASAHRVIEVVSDSDSEASDLEEVISLDPTLTAKLLRVTNSAYYGFSDPVADIRRAIVILGFNSVRSLALSISVCDLFRSDDKIGLYSRAQLWQHSVTVGVASKMICRRTGFGESEEGFVGGMLHDIGMVIEDQYAHDLFEQVVQATEAGEGELWQNEREILGIDHAELGRRLSAKWRFPDTIAKAIGLHHQPSLADKDSELAHVLHIADFIACAKKISHGVRDVAPPRNRVLQETWAGQERRDGHLRGSRRRAQQGPRVLRPVSDRLQASDRKTEWHPWSLSSRSLIR